MINRRTFICAIADAFLAAPFVAKAQQPTKVYRLGFLAPNSPATTVSQLAGFRDGLRDLGYVEGRNITTEYRWAAGNVARFSEFAVELVGLKVDVILATSAAVALAARNATRTIPIVFATSSDPVGSGLVASMAHPGGNITGLSLLAPEIVPKQLQLLKEAVPKTSRIAVLSNPANPAIGPMVKETEAAARSLGMRIQLLEARRADALDSAFAAITKERPDALLVLADPLLVAHAKRIAEFANNNHLPAMYPHREFAEAGGLMAYGASLPDLFRRAAIYVDKILKGAKPADLPVEQPTKFEFVINLKTAKAMGLTIPQPLLLRANEVIQ